MPLSTYIHTYIHTAHVCLCPHTYIHAYIPGTVLDSESEQNVAHTYIHTYMIHTWQGAVLDTVLEQNIRDDVAKSGMYVCMRMDVGANTGVCVRVCM